MTKGFALGGLMGVLAFAVPLSVSANSPSSLQLTFNPTVLVAGQQGEIRASFGSPSGSDCSFNAATVFTLSGQPYNRTVINENMANEFFYSTLPVNLPAGVHQISAEVTGTNCSVDTASTSFTVVAAPATIPTMSEWTMIGMGALMLAGGAIYATRRRRYAG